ncbi:homocysteine S-methyltransferase family protein [Francisellaceae bacterium]|nr:homocysteine S-methyltransferase family protein [Francisellaceae bacterium]
MSFSTLYEKTPYFFYDGPMETRIEYGTDLKLDQEMSIFTLLESKTGSLALRNLYRKDIEAAIPFNVPIILNAPTFRASKEHCKRLNISETPEHVYQINEQCILFLREIRNEFPDYKHNILITAPIGPKYAGFTPDLVLGVEDEILYHQEQVSAVAKIGVDVMTIAAMPGAKECLGAAIAASKTNCDYTVGFVVTDKGTLLDGTPIEKLIMEVDEQTKSHQPLGYIIGCTHSTAAAAALQKKFPEFKRIIGIKANGSGKPPEELLALDRAESDFPKELAQELYEFGSPRGFKIYGGCCGTDDMHLAAIIKRVIRG